MCGIQKHFCFINIGLLGCIRLTKEGKEGITQKGVGEYFEDYPTFVYKADIGGFQEKKSVYITTWVKTAFVTQ